jgi:microcystin-dependent protein
MTFSTQRVTSDGTLSSLALSIDYFDRDEISVFFDNIVDALPWSWVGLTEKTISFSPDVPNGVEVLVRRTTPLAEVFHDFDGGAAFVATTVDENFKQVLHIAQEAVEGGTTGDFFNNLNMHGYKITNLGDPVNPGDAVNLERFTVQENLVITYRNQTIVYRDQAEAFALAAAASASSVDTATLLARANHTGTQAISTVTGLQTALDGTIKTTGAQTKAGVLTLSDEPIIPVATLDTSPVRKEQFDLGAVPTGAIMSFPATAAPTGWLKANGALLSRTTYAALWAFAQASGNLITDAAWTTDRPGSFSTGDGSTTFRIPDLRGLFQKGWHDGSATYESDTGAAIGKYRDSQNKAHTHIFTTTSSTAGGTGQPAATSGANAYTPATSSSGSTEAFPRHVLSLICIKY